VRGTVAEDYTLALARGRLAVAAAQSGADRRWAEAATYLSLSSRLAECQERLAVFPEEPLLWELLWGFALECERLADRAQRGDWAELDALTEAEQYLQDLALDSQREEERL